MVGKILVAIGLLLTIIGLLYPLGFVQEVMIKYILFIGIIILGVGIIYLPGVNKS